MLALAWCEHSSRLSIYRQTKRSSLYLFLLSVSGQTSPLPYGHVITGVAIANTAEPLAVYFGCYSDQTTVGGMGMVRVSSIGSKQVRLMVTSHLCDFLEFATVITIAHYDDKIRSRTGTMLCESLTII